MKNPSSQLAVGTSPSRDSPKAVLPSYRAYDPLPVGCATVDADGRIKDINRRGAEMLGWTARWLVGRSLGKWVLSDDAPLFEAHLRAAALSRQGVSERLRVKNRHGRIRDMRWESVAARGAGEGAGQVVTVMIDMSEDPKQERLARFERAKLLQAGRVNMLGEIAAGLAHDLSQPLGAILLNSTVGLELQVRVGAAAAQRH
jgi:PAS domain S-box-containing protein